MHPKFLGVSTGRAGSVWVSKVFNRAGLKCSHEQVYNARRFHNGQPSWNTPGRLGEWSAQAVPFLEDYTGVVFHQVRHPLKVIASYVHRGTFESPSVEARFIIDHSGVSGSPVEMAARFWVVWNRLCEKRADVRWRLETFDAATLEKAGDMLGVPVINPTEALGVPPANTSPAPPLVWDDIPNRSEVSELAAEYGY